MLKKMNTILIVLLLYISFSLFAAYYIEYGLGHKSCSLCLYQKIPYIFSIILILNILFTQKYKKITLITLSFISIVGTILALYHLGIEQEIFSDSFCEVATSYKEGEIKEVLKNVNDSPLSCKNPSFKTFGLSLAALNAISSLFLFFIFIRLCLYKKL